jgi:hypothetical protein
MLKISSVSGKCLNRHFVRFKVTSSKHLVPCLVTNIYFDIRAMQCAHNAPVLEVRYIKVVLIF